MVKYFLFVAIFLISSCKVCVWNFTNDVLIEDKFQEIFLDSLVYAIAASSKSCPQSDKKVSYQLFKDDINNFEVSGVFNEVLRLSTTLKLSSRDTILIGFYYPFTSFDPSIGYETYFCVYGVSFNGGIDASYVDSLNAFRYNFVKNESIENTLNFYNELIPSCESGYIVHYYLNGSLRPIDCKIKLGTSPFFINSNISN